MSRSLSFSSQSLALLFTAALGLGLSACSKNTSSAASTLVKPTSAAQDQESPPASAKTIIESAMDLKADPCEDFYQYSCGTWVQNFQLPEDRSHYFMKGTSIEDQFHAEMITLLKKESANKSEIGEVYQACLERPEKSSENLKVLLQELAPISAMQTVADLPLVLAGLHKQGLPALISVSAASSFSDSKKNIAHLSQDPFTLPDQDFYISKDDEMVKIRADYQIHISKMLLAAGLARNDQEARLKAQDILQTETLLAQNALSTTDAWDPGLSNNPSTYEKIQTAFAWNWPAYLQALGVASPEAKEWNVDQPKFLTYFSEFAQKTDLKSLKNFLAWKVLNALAPELGGSLEQESFNFWQLRLRGQKTPTSLEKSCLHHLEGLAANNLAVLFIQSHPEAADVKKSGENFVQRLKDAFVANLSTLTWLNEETKIQVVAKINKMASQIAYSDRYEQVDLSQVQTDTFVGSDLQLSALKVAKNLNQIGKAVDRSEWDMQPYEDNAYYAPDQNKIVLPFTNWVPPYYDYKGSDAANLGSVAYIAHEISHGFDSSGSQYDSDGNMNDWWSQAEKDAFAKLNQCNIDQADHYKVKQGWNLKGAQTLDENLADQGGIKFAYLAFQKMKDQLPSVSGNWSADQQFFIAYAQSWCSQETDQNVYTQINSDAHAPVEFRVNGVVMNMEAFAKAFNCKAGARLNPEVRCHTW